MNLIGEFRKGEIDGKPFLIYTLLSQTNSPSSTVALTDLPLQQPLFICPHGRSTSEHLRNYMNGYDLREVMQYIMPPDVPNTQQLVEQRYHMCKLPILPLFWCNNKEVNFFDFYCGVCQSSKLGTHYYFCVICRNKFHKECVESPLEIKHPSHLFQSLQLYHLALGSVECDCCELEFYNIFYRCPTLKLNIHPICAMKPTPIVIDHPKRHPHPLTFFPKQASLPCDVCGLTKKSIPTYACLQCVFVVHRDCIYFPYVIKISRHQHRISFTYSLPTQKLSCGVCRKKVDNFCGAYSCNNCEEYYVHTRCTLREDVWDGTELEGISEEPEIEVHPFKKISDGIVLHFSHGHPLKLQISSVYDEEKLCQACVVPIYEGNYYSCMDQCDFILHEVCANAPRKKHHLLHPRPLILKIVDNGYDKVGYFTCDACHHRSCGFVYEDRIGKKKFCLDLRCASVSEPFTYEGHEHPLFLSLNRNEEKSARCQICRKSKYRKLSCIECDYIICFRCATSPYKARYKHDKHFLTFYEMKEARDHSEWCDACERKIEEGEVDSGTRGFYSCDDCCTTLHIKCLLGRDPYMKPGQTIHYISEDFEIIRNNTMSRPDCYNCSGPRCRTKIIFKTERMNFCSLYCADE